MTKYPEKKLTSDDIPAAVWNRASFSVRERRTGGWEIVRKLDCNVSCVDHKSSQEAAIREAIRLQKRENKRHWA